MQKKRHKVIISLLLVQAFFLGSISHATEVFVAENCLSPRLQGENLQIEALFAQHLLDNQLKLLEEDGQSFYANSERRDSGKEIGRRTFSDFSDTIAKPQSGSLVDDNGSFRSFEERLREIVAEDELDGVAKEDFLNQAKSALEEFKAIRRNKDSQLSLTDKMKIWLHPFEGKLRQEHIDKLVAEFELNDNFFRAIDIMQDELGYGAVRTVSFESGTLTEIIKAFLEKPEVKGEMEKRRLSYAIDAQGLGLSESEGVFDISKMPEVTSRLIIDGNVAYPEISFVLGDTTMEGYKPGFGSNLLNVQNFDEQLFRKRVSHIYTGLLSELKQQGPIITEKNIGLYPQIEQAI